MEWICKEVNFWKIWGPAKTLMSERPWVAEYLNKNVNELIDVYKRITSEIEKKLMEI